MFCRSRADVVPERKDSSPPFNATLKPRHCHLRQHRRRNVAVRKGRKFLSPPPHPSAIIIIFFTIENRDCSQGNELPSPAARSSLKPAIFLEGNKTTPSARERTFPPCMLKSQVSSQSSSSLKVTKGVNVRRS